MWYYCYKRFNFSDSGNNIEHVQSFKSTLTFLAGSGLRFLEKRQQIIYLLLISGRVRNEAMKRDRELKKRNC
jgi:hypothetical protein